MEQKSDQRIIDEVAFSTVMLEKHGSEMTKEEFVLYYFNVWPLFNDGAKKKKLEALYSEYAPKKK